MEEKSWCVAAIMEIIQGNYGGDVNNVLKELVDWCVDDDEQAGGPSSPHLPREEHKLRVLADKLGELQIARDTLIHKLDLLVAKLQSTVSSPPGDVHRHQDQDEDQGPGKAPILTTSSSSSGSSSSSPETEGTVLPPADDRDRGDQNITVEPVDGDYGIGEHSADINAQGQAPAIATPPPSSSSESEVGTSSASVPSHQGVGGQNIAIELIDDGDDQSVQDHAEANVAPEIMIPSSSSSASSSESDVPIVW